MAVRSSGEKGNDASREGERSLAPLRVVLSQVGLAGLGLIAVRLIELLSRSTASS